METTVQASTHVVCWFLWRHPLGEWQPPRGDCAISSLSLTLWSLFSCSHPWSLPLTKSLPLAISMPTQKPVSHNAIPKLLVWNSEATLLPYNSLSIAFWSFLQLTRTSLKYCHLGWNPAPRRGWFCASLCAVQEAAGEQWMKTETTGPLNDMWNRS